MATNSNILAWKIPWTEKPGELQSMRLQRVIYNLVTKLPPCQKKKKKIFKKIKATIVKTVEDFVKIKI